MNEEQKNKPLCWGGVLQLPALIQRIYGSPLLSHGSCRRKLTACRIETRGLCGSIALCLHDKRVRTERISMHLFGIPIYTMRIRRMSQM